MEAESSRGVVGSRPLFWSGSWHQHFLTSVPGQYGGRILERVVGSRPLFWSGSRRQHFLTLVPSQYGSRILERGRRIEACVAGSQIPALFDFSSRSVWRPNPREGSSNRGRSELAGECTQHFFTLVRGQYGGRILERGRRIEACVAVPDSYGSTF